MNSEFVHFRWGVPERGYIWDQEAKVDKYLEADPTLTGPFLIANPDSSSVNRYDPLIPPKETDQPLFVRFSELHTQDQFISFANAYGWMGTTTPLYRADQMLRGEAISQWERETASFRRVIALWMALQGQDDLRSIVKWNSRAKTISIEIGGTWELLATGEDYRPHLYDTIVSGNTIVPSWAIKAAVILRVNDKLRQTVSPSLLFADRHRNIGGYLRPHHLLGALWMMFYQAVIGERPVRRCTYCRRLMEVPLGSRTTKVMHDRCANTKKVMAYRKRRYRARVMAERGVAIRKIAATLKTDLSSVKGWLSNRKADT